MNTTVISEDSFEAGWVGRPKAMGVCESFELVKGFGDRLYSIAKHITQNDDDAENVLIETFLEVCSDLDGYQANEKVWLRLVTIAAREALSKLHNRGPGRPLLHRVPDSSEDLVVREFSVWGDDYQQRYSRERTTCVLEHGLRSLDPMCRTVFVLRDIEDTSVEHIATIVNRSVAAVKVCLLRARLQLREMLTRQMRQQQWNPDIQIRGIGPPQRDLLITMYDRFDPLGAALGLPPRTAEARYEWIGSALGQKLNVAAFSPIGEVVGHCFLAADKPASAEMAVFVRQESRRIGVGTALVKAALDWGGAAGLRHVWSLTPSDNRVALRMQMNCGFRLTKSVSIETELEIDLPQPLKDLSYGGYGENVPGICGRAGRNSFFTD